jgi:hypothetical protein
MKLSESGGKRFWEEGWFVIKKRKLYHFKSHEETRAVAKFKLTDACVFVLPTSSSIACFDWNGAIRKKACSTLESLFRRGRRRFSLPDDNSSHPLFLEECGYWSPNFHATIASAQAPFAFEIIRERRKWCLGFASLEDMMQWKKSIESQSSVPESNAMFDRLDKRISAWENGASEKDDGFWESMQDLRTYLNSPLGLEAFTDFLVSNLD